MPLLFAQFQAPGIAQLSYAVGDDSARIAAIIDPRPDVDVYIDWARAEGVVITHIIETHIHADFMSGSRELQRRLPTATIVVSERDAEAYGFDHMGVSGGEEIDLGDFRLTVRHTPGHTPEHISLLVSESGRHEHPFAVFSGDTLFVDSIGRPDLLGEGRSEQLAGRLFESIRNFYLELEDSVIVYPGHGAGSSCGPDIGDRNSTTIGHERRHNPYLQVDDREAFIQKVLASAPPEPRHYKPLKEVNTRGPETFGQLPPVPALTPLPFRKAAQSGKHEILDVRHPLAFGGGHIRGALNIEGRPELSVWSGWMLPLDRPLLLVMEDQDAIERIAALLWRVGHTRLTGYLAGGMTAWSNEGRPLEISPPISVQDVRKAEPDRFQILDVRTPQERESGFIPGSTHMFVPDIEGRLDELDRERPVVTYCATGFRASIAASVLARNGFSDVRAMPGSWSAWRAADYPIANAEAPAGR